MALTDDPMTAKLIWGAITMSMFVGIMWLQFKIRIWLFEYSSEPFPKDHWIRKLLGKK